MRRVLFGRLVKRDELIPKPNLSSFYASSPVVLSHGFLDACAGRGATQLCTSQQTTDVAKYIGLRHGTALPPELKLIASSLVSVVGEEKGYGMTEVRRGTTRMLWFEHMTHLDDKGIAYWEVKDVMVLSRVPKKQVLVYYNCFLNNRPDGEIAAVLDYEPGVEYFTRARRAWRANRQTVEVIQTKGIKCENLGF